MTPARPHRVLLLEPDEPRRAWLAEALREAGLEVDAAGTMPALAEKMPWDVVVLAHEHFSPQIVSELQARDPLLPVLVATLRRPEPPAAVELGRARVHDVVEVRQRADASELAGRVRSAAERRARRLQPRRVAEEVVGVSDAVQQVRRYVDAASQSDASVLITGESGTGKELVARAIHRHGSRAPGPFIALNCSAIPETLLESELFGHEKGSFTGAVGRTRGLFEQASGGTLFFDEIGDMPMPLQAKLLRVLQPPPGATSTTREFTRIGGDAPVRADVRMLFATHRDIPAEVATGRFREDLFQRIAVLTIRMPALRERRGDIPILARLFLEQFAAAEGRPGLWFDPVALDVLCAYDWPRNVRELESVVRSIVLLKEQGGPVILGELPSQVFGAPPSPASSEGPKDGPLRTLGEVAREHVERVLAHCAGNKSRAARILGISRQALDRKLAAWAEGKTDED